MSKKHVSEVASARFEAAVRASLKQLIEQRQVFSVTDVVASAKYDDGAKVGTTTIYAKNSKGVAVHAKLLAEVKAAAVASRSRRSAVDVGVPSGSVVHANLGVFRQLVEQEARLQQADAAIAGLRLQLANAQEGQYVALACLNALSKGAVLDVIRPMRELESIFADEELVDRLGRQAQALAATCGRLVRAK